MRKIEIDDQLRIVRWQFAIRIYTPKTSIRKGLFGKYWVHVKYPMGSCLIGFFKKPIDIPVFMKIG